MNAKDEIALTDYWHRETSSLNEKVDEAFKLAQNHAYELGIKRAQTDALSLEKQYAERLGRLAQLCDVVCGWIESGSAHCTIDEMNAAKDEIMDYVDAVRP